MALLWSWPLARHLPTHLPGANVGDNVQFLWNFWWMRAALASGLDFFHTPYLFAPVGVDLTLHTHTALPALAGATLLGSLSVVTAHNLAVVGSLFLNAFCAYLLAWRVTGARGAALVAAVVFGGSPYIDAHLNGHFNLTAAWTIPLLALTLPATMRGSARSAVLSGLVLAVTAYVDYYYVVYELALAAGAFAIASRAWRVTTRGATPHTRRIARVVGVLIAIDVAAIAAIAATGGFVGAIGPIRISARDTFNLLQALWLLVAFALWLRWRPLVEAARRPEWAPARDARALAIALVVFAIAALPLVWHGAAILLRGEYVSQRYYWRSAPKGIDVATLVLGNPFHGLWGGPVRQAYARFGIDAIEGGAWLGVAPMLLAAWSLRRRWAAPAVRYWTAIGAIFFVWALGPHLMAFGANTGMILPQTILRYVPLAANARVPGRAIVVVYLAIAILAALAAAEWRLRRGPAVLGAIVLAVAADYVPAPFPLAALDRPAIYETLRDRPERGALLELPAGTRDSFERRGSLDHRVIAYQTIHERPITGGIVSRLPPAVAAAYAADPLIDAVLALSEGRRPGDPPAPEGAAARALLRKDDIAFVMLNRETAPPALVEYVERSLPLALVAEEGPRSLYAVVD